MDGFGLFLKSSSFFWTKIKFLRFGPCGVTKRDVIVRIFGRFFGGFSASQSTFRCMPTPTQSPLSEEDAPDKKNTWMDGDVWLGGGFKPFFIFTAAWGNDPMWRSYFSDGLKPPTSWWLRWRVFFSQIRDFGDFGDLGDKMMVLQIEFLKRSFLKML